MSTETRHFYEFGPYRLVPAERLLLREGAPVRLNPKDFEMLVVLVGRSGQLVEKDELLRTVWPGEKFVEEANLTNSVYRLRNALGGKGYIETVPKHGYRFVAEVRSQPDARAELL